MLWSQTPPLSFKQSAFCPQTSQGVFMHLACCCFLFCFSYHVSNAWCEQRLMLPAGICCTCKSFTWQTHCIVALKKCVQAHLQSKGVKCWHFYQSQWHLTDIYGVLWHLGTKHLSYAIVRRGCHSKFLLNCFNPNRIIFLNWTKSYLCLNLNSEARKIRPHTRFQRGHEPPLQWQTCSLMVDGIKNGCSQREVSHRFWTLHFHASVLVIWLLPCCFIFKPEFNQCSWMKCWLIKLTITTLFGKQYRYSV